jgi:hypothetical protein
LACKVASEFKGQRKPSNGARQGELTSAAGAAMFGSHIGAVL